eukprot:TRINITY_DN42439_c0_g1_i1.p1 TRINITY_DN42439_c0_g1~~TRINITY_DN42439_c0_g1_i1.p1  ORF type:complete len:237 (+),score=32.63 TRINITY_DN42439_c0_g1_i1:53-763(+)
MKAGRVEGWAEPTARPMWSQTALMSGMISAKTVFEQIRGLVASSQVETAIEVLDNLIVMPDVRVPLLEAECWMLACKPILTFTSAKPLEAPEKPAKAAGFLGRGARLMPQRFETTKRVASEVQTTRTRGLGWLRSARSKLSGADKRGSGLHAICPVSGDLADLDSDGNTGHDELDHIVEHLCVDLVDQVDSGAEEDSFDFGSPPAAFPSQPRAARQGDALPFPSVADSWKQLLEAS